MNDNGGGSCATYYLPPCFFCTFVCFSWSTSPAISLSLHSSVDAPHLTVRLWSLTPKSRPPLLSRTSISPKTTISSETPPSPAMTSGVGRREAPLPPARPTSASPFSPMLRAIIAATRSANSTPRLQPSLSPVSASDSASNVAGFMRCRNLMRPKGAAGVGWRDTT